MAEVEWEEAVFALSKLSPTETSNLCHALAEQICHDRVPPTEAYLKNLTLEEWWQVTGTLQAFMKLSVKQDWKKDQMLEAMGPVPDGHKKAAIEVISIHRADIRLRLLSDTTAISQCVLKDFDWQLKLTMSSDKLSSLNEPLLNVDLDLQDGSGNSQQVAVELDQADLRKLITSLEGCSKAVQQLTV